MAEVAAVQEGEVQLDNNNLIRLISEDELEFLVPPDVARMSSYIRHILDFGQTEAEENNPTVQVEKVRSDILERVIAWATYHKDDPPFEEQDADDDNGGDRKVKRTDNICPWDMEFLKDMQQPILFDMIAAAMFLNLKALKISACQTVANMIKGKTPEEIRATFNIQSNFAPGEEEAIRKSNEWMDDPQSSQSQ